MRRLRRARKTPDPSRTGFGGGGRPGAAAPRPGEYTPSTLSTAAPTGRVLRNQVNAFLKEEGVAVALTPGYNGDGGTIFASYGGSQDPKDPVGPPMAAITPEQYNRICRLLQHGITPKLTFDIETEYQKDDLMGFNVVGEIPGTTKADEVVMVGGHFDSWQGGTGATDNGTGSAVAMEAVRILATLHKPMARTVRVALWGGEEEGLYGSLAYVQQHFAPRDTMKKTPEYDKLDVYFNDDSGSGKFRAVSALGNAAACCDLPVVDRAHQGPGHRGCYGRDCRPHRRSPAARTRPASRGSAWTASVSCRIRWSTARVPTTPTWTCMTACRRAM